MGSSGIKRALDAAGALALIVLLSPIMLLIAALVAMEGGPVLFGHERVGFGGRPFRCLKFRTMVPNAAEVLADLLARDPAAAREWATTQKLRNDPRITHVGKFLRKTSLDELPQLWNILVGEMSLVGPRPIVQSEVERYGSDIDYYYAVRPGLTGLWQVRGRSNTSYAERIEMDFEYVSSRSVGRDLKILIETVPAVLRRSGAF
ncbi:MAG: sugar transferase [Alphaproteobacteria bacterium]|nr:sugar transferase [Alphaproteobacteria bacterium]